VTEAPTPILPRGAGGPLRRAAGRVSRGSGSLCAGSGTPDLPSALVVEPDPLVRLLVLEVVRDLGFAISPSAAAAGTVFVSLDRPEGCRRVRAARPPADAGKTSAVAAPFVVGYGSGPLAPLAAHRAHACADLVLALRVADDRAVFTHLPVDDPVRRSGLSVREADVLVLLLAGLTTLAIAARLCISPATARSHCRAVLGKMGAADRMALRAGLAGTSRSAAADPDGGGAPRFA